MPKIEVHAELDSIGEFQILPSVPLDVSFVSRNRDCKSIAGTVLFVFVWIDLSSPFLLERTDLLLDREEAVVFRDAKTPEQFFRFSIQHTPKSQHTKCDI